MRTRGIIAADTVCTLPPSLSAGGGGRAGKINIKGELPKKGEFGQFADLTGGLAKKRGWCF